MSSEGEQNPSMNSDSRAKRILIIIAILAGGSAISPLIVGSDIALRSLLVTVPLSVALLVSVLSLRKSQQSSTGNGEKPILHHFSMLVCVSVFFAVEILSVAVRLQSQERTLPYFGLQAVAVLCVSAQVFLGGLIRPHRAPLILAQVGVFLGMEILLKTLPFDYFIGNTDVAFHEQYAQGIVDSGHIGSCMGTYYRFPLMHVLTASIAELTNAFSTLESIQFLFGVCGFIVPFLVFSIVWKASRNYSLSLTMSFISPLGYYLLDYISQGMPYVLAFFFFLFLMLSGFGLKLQCRYWIVGVVFIVAVILTHQVSIPFIIVVLFVSSALHRHYFGTSTRRGRSGINIAILLLVAYSAYSVLYAIVFYGNVLSLFAPSAEFNLPATLSSASLLPYYVIRRLPFSLFLFFAFLGILSFSGYAYPFRGSAQSRPVIGVGLVAMFFFIPGFSYAVLFVDQYLAAGNRYTVFAEQLVSCFAALALIRSRALNRLRTALVVASLVTVFVFGAIVNEANINDTFALGQPGPKVRVYFTDEDMNGLSYVEAHIGEQTMWSDFVVSRYLNAHDIDSKSPSVDSNGTVFFPAGSLVYLRVAELDANALYFYQPSAKFVSALKFSAFHTTDTTSIRMNSIVVFDSGGTVILACQGSSWIGDS